MKFSQIKDLINIKDKSGDFSKEILLSGVATDSRFTEKGDIFICSKGDNFDSAVFLNNLFEISMILADIKDKKTILSIYSGDKPIVFVDNLQETRDKLFDLFYSGVFDNLKIIGITGTNGKTTTAYLIYQLLKKLNKKAALLGTINYLIGDREIKSFLTTPDKFILRKLFSCIKKSNMEYVVMEVSSHALAQDRVRELSFDQAIFTNLTEDHFDYHENAENYFLAKTKIFDLLSSQGVVITNLDDDYGQRVFEKVKNKKIGISLESSNDIKVSDLVLSKEGISFSLNLAHKTSLVKTDLVGLFNVYNLLFAIVSIYTLGFKLNDFIEFIKTINPPKGRLQKVGPGVFIDYAHTPDALEKVLNTLKDVGYKKVILVFGCGGSRDKTKRAIMGRIASEKADFSIITSDNPRMEDPLEICKQIELGFKTNNYVIVSDRYQAIKKAIGMMDDKYCAVLIAGKGHEDYQIFKDKTVEFSDFQVVGEVLKNI